MVSGVPGILASSGSTVVVVSDGAGCVDCGAPIEPSLVQAAASKAMIATKIRARREPNRLVDLRARPERAFFIIEANIVAKDRT